MDATHDRIAAIRGILLALPILYVVGSGPFLRFAADHPRSTESVFAFYRPLVNFSVKIRSDELLVKYVGWYGADLVILYDAPGRLLFWAIPRGNQPQVIRK